MCRNIIYSIVQEVRNFQIFILFIHRGDAGGLSREYVLRFPSVS